ncbi:TetR/AcrR family transcriptional regulator [Pseudomonas moorei]|uniref:DNA-binding transcriptional regulator, AcrR family n=1 Tax=Pseudomonas moorei TaxID=395599 RepID=A0A1H1IDE9_9PSED|nr:TetR/AcrR family transcriptional regulator [Pseudomonas moorei]KAB0508989.1 TetR/AcrR family transcriptional regulator [Pseudomonas moorei]SDR35388.1 DNA-binding transcriptional regulator, AcrR family [Pseudomonas moorei]
MKKKTEARRLAIREAAGQVFKELGFEGTSMAEVAQRLGYSKATLYSYFDSKEALFYEVLMDSTNSQMDEIFQIIEKPLVNLRKDLEVLGEKITELLYSEEVMAVRRLLLSEAGRKNELGLKCYQAGPAQFLSAISQSLQNAMGRGLLRQSDPEVAALHMRALLEAEWIDHFLFSTSKSESKIKIRATTGRAVEAFLLAYGVPMSKP